MSPLAAVVNAKRTRLSVIVRSVSPVKRVAIVIGNPLIATVVYSDASPTLAGKQFAGTGIRGTSAIRAR
jgi:hypothetical protein